MSGLCMVGWIKQIIEYNQYLKRIISFKYLKDVY